MTNDHQPPTTDKLLLRHSLRIKHQASSIKHHFVLLLVAILLSACAVTPTDPAPPAATVAPAETANVTFGALAWEQQSYAPVIAAFNAQHTDVRVQFVALDEFMHGERGAALDGAALLQRVASAADTAALPALPAAALPSGAVANLKPLLDADPTFNRADYYLHALDAPTGGDTVYLLPRTLHISLLAYNKDLWTLNNLPAPSPSWTWADLLASAAQVAKKRGNDIDVYGLVDWDGGLTALASELRDRNVGLLGAPTTNDPPRLDQPAVAAAIDRLVALARSGAVYAGEADKRSAAITDGRAAIWRAELLPGGANAQPPRFAVGAATVPPLAFTLFPPTQAGYVMSSGSQHQSAAWRWLSFLSHQDVRPPGSTSGVSELPARISLAERAGYWANLDAETTAAVKAMLERAPFAASATYDAQIVGPLRKALAATIGGKRARDALDDAQTAFDTARAESSAAPTAAPVSDAPIVATPAAIPDNVTQITFRTMGLDASAFQQAARDFNARTPAVFVTVKGSEGIAKFKDLADSADCFLWWGAPPEQDADAARDLQPLIDADATFPRDDELPALLAPFQRGTTLYALPHEVRFRVLAYNDELFKTAKLAPPAAQSSLDDLRNAAQQLTLGRGDTKQYGYAVPGSQTSDLLFFLARSGVAVTIGSGTTAAPHFTDSSVGLAIRAYRDLLLSSSPHVRLLGYSTDATPDAQAFNLIQQGRVGMWFDDSGAALFAGQRAGQHFTIGVAPPPLNGLAPTPDDASATGLYISAKSEHAQACWSWLKYLSGDVTTLRQGFPARRSVATSAAFSASAAPGATAVYAAYSAAFARATGTAPETPARSRVDFYWLFQAVDRALAGSDLDRDLARAQDTTTQFVRCLDGGGTSGECARQVDAAYKGLR